MAGRPNGRVKEWKGWQGRTEKDGNGKGPGPSGSRPVKGPLHQSPDLTGSRPVEGSFGHPPPVSQRAIPSRSGPPGLGPSRVRSVTLPRSAKGPFRQGPARRVSARRGFVRSPSPGQPKSHSIKGSARPESQPTGISPRQSRAPSRLLCSSRVQPNRVSARRGFVRSLPRSAKGPFHQGPARPGLGSPRGRSVSLPRSAKGPFRQVPARPESQPTGISPRQSRIPSRSRPNRVSACQGFVRPSPGQPKDRSVKVPARRSSSPGGSPHPSTSESPPHLSHFPPLHPPPLHFLLLSSTPPAPLPIRRPAPPSCVPVRLSRRGRDSTARGGIARAKMWNGISGAERGAAAASGAPLPRPPGSRPEPTPSGQTSRKGERGVPEKGKTRNRKGFSSRRGRKRRSGRAAKGRPVEQCRCTEVKRSSGKAVPR